MTELTDEQVYAVLATFERKPVSSWRHKCGDETTWHFEPDYFYSLDAMRRVEEKMEFEIWDAYRDELLSPQQKSSVTGATAKFTFTLGLVAPPHIRARCAARVLVDMGIVELET